MMYWAIASAAAFAPVQTSNLIRAQRQAVPKYICMREIPPSTGRRVAMQMFSIGIFAAARPVSAFDNAIPQYAEYKDKAKRPGTAPKDLGIAKRSVKGEDPLDDIEFVGLRGCDGKPNCFSTSTSARIETAAAHVPTRLSGSYAPRVRSSQGQPETSTWRIVFRRV